MICVSKAFVCLLFALAGNVGAWSFNFKPKPRATLPAKVSVSKPSAKPVLVVNDGATGTNVHLVGVSHGSQSSANLVSETIDNVNPGVVVLELCDDRFMSISIDAEIVPKDKSMRDKYDDIQSKLAKRRQVYQGDGSSGRADMTFPNLLGILRFAKGQGFIGGLFVLMGMAVGNIQKLTSASTGDEFVTAMREAEKRNIPIRLGDAPQNMTVRSITKVVSAKTVSPTDVVKGAKNLAFAAFGIVPGEATQVVGNKAFDVKDLQKKKWINIPLVYLNNLPLVQSILPLIGIYALTASIAVTPLDMSPAFADQVTDSSAYLSQQMDIVTAASQNAGFGMIDIGNVDKLVGEAANTLSSLLLIRMTKLIGTDRDAIIASKVRRVMKDPKFKGKDIVVVIGMLHCNGVARWLTLGDEPLKYADISDRDSDDPDLIEAGVI
jgi:pheromone shutdown protein TraB